MSNGLRADPAAQPPLGRSPAVARGHRDDEGDPQGRRNARHRHPRPPGDRPQGARELQEPRTDLISYFAYLATRIHCRTVFELCRYQDKRSAERFARCFCIRSAPTTCSSAKFMSAANPPWLDDVSPPIPVLPAKDPSSLRPDFHGDDLYSSCQ